MNYELAKKLKEAGFVQKVAVGGQFYHFVSHPRVGIPPQQSVNTSFVVQDKTGDELSIVIPTLSELIEACGSAFRSLYVKTRDGDYVSWCAIPIIDEQKYYGTGSTPEEAVANLWLALNK